MSEDIEAALDQVRRHLMDGEPVLGEAAARRHLQSSPANFRLQKALSVSLMMQGNFKESVPLLQRLHLEVPGDSDVAVNLAKAHLELKQHDDAEALLAQIDALEIILSSRKKLNDVIKKELKDVYKGKDFKVAVVSIIKKAQIEYFKLQWDKSRQFTRYDIN